MLKNAATVELNQEYLLVDGKPFLFSGFSCHPNGFGVVGEADPNKGPSLGEDLVMLRNRGAIASWASISPATTALVEQLSPLTMSGAGGGTRASLRVSGASGIERTDLS